MYLSGELESDRVLVDPDERVERVLVRVADPTVRHTLSQATRITGATHGAY